MRFHVKACTAVRDDDELRPESGGAERAAVRKLWAFPQEPYLLAALFVCFALLARYFPLSGDDWAWGSSIGIERLESHFAAYNGRWSGNLAVLLLTRSPLLATSVVAFTLCLIIFLMTRISSMRNPTGYAIGLAVLLLMPLGTWRQTVVWLAGFSNYALSTVGLLFFVLATQRALRGYESQRSWVTAVLVVPFAAVSAMFVEHVTVALVVFSVVSLALVLLMKRPWLVQAAWAVGSIAGAALMFSNSAYRNVADGTSAYQHVDDTGIRAVAEQALGEVSQLSVAVNLGLNACVLATLGVLAWMAHRSERHLPAGAVVSLVGASVGLVGGACVSALAPGTAPSEIVEWSWVSSAGMLVGLVCGALFLVIDEARRNEILALIALVVVLIAPAAIMRPYGPRNFLPTYVLLAVILLILVREFMSRGVRTEVKAVITAAGLSTAAVIFGGYFAVYAYIDHVNEDRLDTIRTAVAEGEQRITVPKLPYRYHVHMGDPPNARFVERFKLFHHIPNSTTVRFVR